MTRKQTEDARRERIEHELEAIADQLEELEPLYAKRLQFWLEGVVLGMTQRELAAPSRVGEGAVTQALRKHRLNGGKLPRAKPRSRSVAR